MKFFIILIITIVLNASPAMADGGGNSRCSVPHCLCEVRPGPRPDARVTVRPEERRGSIYFSEGSYTASQYQSTALTRFIESTGSLSTNNITLIGYTDGCGTVSHNRVLAYSRASEARAIIRRNRPNARISIQIVGEGSAGHSPETRRVDVIIHTQRSLTTRIDKIPADFYLIDASGSMWSDWRSWQDIINASVKPNSRVFLSIMTGCRNGQYIGNISPQSGTEIWYSYWKILEEMSPGQTLLVVSDFQSNYPLTNRERQAIEDRVRERGITVHTAR